jgi:hypothetical protein
MSGGRCEDNRKGGMVTRAHQPCLNSASSRSRCVCVGILGAVGREGRNSRLSHYHETSGLAQTHEELVHTTWYIYKILHCHTETRVPHREALAPNIQILNTYAPPFWKRQQVNKIVHRIIRLVCTIEIPDDTNPNHGWSMINATTDNMTMEDVAAADTAMADNPTDNLVANRVWHGYTVGRDFPHCTHTRKHCTCICVVSGRCLMKLIINKL